MVTVALNSNCFPALLFALCAEFSKRTSIGLHQNFIIFLSFIASIENKFFQTWPTSINTCEHLFSKKPVTAEIWLDRYHQYRWIAAPSHNSSEAQVHAALNWTPYRKIRSWGLLSRAHPRLLRKLRVLGSFSSIDRHPASLWQVKLRPTMIVIDTASGHR